MKTFFKWVGIVTLVIVAGIAAFFLSMRFHDGPNGIIAGGPFQTGQLSEPPESWDFLKGRVEIEFQTLDPETSRIVWLGVLDGRLYIISGYMNTTFGKIWKHWPYYLAEDDRIILRIDGSLYEQRLQRLMSFEKLPELMAIYADKYGDGLTQEASEQELASQLASGSFWLFEVTDR